MAAEDSAFLAPRPGGRRVAGGRSRADAADPRRTDGIGERRAGAVATPDAVVVGSVRAVVATVAARATVMRRRPEIEATTIAAVRPLWTTPTAEAAVCGIVQDRRADTIATHVAVERAAGGATEHLAFTARPFAGEVAVAEAGLAVAVGQAVLAGRARRTIRTAAVGVGFASVGDPIGASMGSGTAIVCIAESTLTIAVQNAAHAVQARQAIGSAAVDIRFRPVVLAVAATNAAIGDRVADRAVTIGAGCASLPKRTAHNCHRSRCPTRRRCAAHPRND
jgi:hypothetical protein